MSLHVVARRTAFTLFAAGLVGCGDQSALLAPDPTRRGDTASAQRGTSAARAKILKRSTRLRDDVVATFTLTPAGGSFTIEDAGLLVHFPPDAVSSDLIITATAHRGDRVVYSFEPHGTVFNEPIMIAQLMSHTVERRRGPNGPDVRGGYLARSLGDVDATGFGAFAETFDTHYAGRGKDPYIVFFTEHFSGYALASGRKSVSVDAPELGT